MAQPCPISSFRGCLAAEAAGHVQVTADTLLLEAIKAELRLREQLSTVLGALREQEPPV